MKEYDQNKLNFFLFIMILASLLAMGLWDFGGSNVKGYSLKNAVLYGSFFIVITTNMLYRRSSFQNVFGYVPLILLFLFASISVIYSPSSKASIISLKGELLDIIILYIIGYNLFRNTIWTERGLHVLALCFGFLNIIAITYYFTGISFFAVDVMHGSTRFASFGGTSNQGAYVLEFFFPLFLYLFLTVQTKLAKATYFIILTTCIAGISLTGSRGGYIGFILQLSLFLILTRYYRAIVPFIAFVGMVLIVVYFAMGDVLIENLFRYQEFQGYDLEKISNGRIYIWKMMLKVIVENPVRCIMGTGWGSYWSYLPQIAQKDTAAHNIYLKILLEVGVIGFIFLLAFITSFYRSIKKNFNGRNSLYFNCTICSLFVILWGGNLALFENIKKIFALCIPVMISYLFLKSRSEDFDHIVRS